MRVAHDDPDIHLPWVARPPVKTGSLLPPDIPYMLGIAMLWRTGLRKSARCS